MVPLLSTLCAFLLVLVVFFPGLSVFFVQDDFVHLAGSTTSQPADLAHWFLPHQYDGFYRPLGVYAPVGILQILFGVHPFPFHLFVFLIHSVNTYLFAKFLIPKARIVPIIAAAGIFATHPAHIYGLTWIAEMSLPLSAFFIMMTLHLLTKYLADPTRARGVFVCIATFAAVLSSEFAITLPLLSLAMQQLGLLPKTSIRRMFPLWMPVLFYVLVRLVVLHPEITAPYAPNFSAGSLASSVLWYGLRTLGLPDYLGITASLTARNLPVIVPLALSVIMTIFAVRFSKLMLSAISWWLAALTPVMFLPNHRLSSYLYIALLGPLAYLALHTRRSLLVLAASGLFALASFFSIRIGWQSNWVIQRAHISSAASKWLIENYHGEEHLYLIPHPPNNQEPYFALAGEAGPRVILKKKDLLVSYAPFVSTAPPGSHTLRLPMIE